MEIITDAQLLERIEAFLKAEDIKPSAFGRLAIGDAALVTQLRAGKRSLSLKTAQKVGEFMTARALSGDSQQVVMAESEASSINAAFNEPAAELSPAKPDEVSGATEWPVAEQVAA